ncbi:BTAD domain-containing putative transcriptional regulator [Streptomyces sp. NPDC050759]|uniref:AfsR/SARP family transcriptional regulator n=1 Tax=Streptomyces sp. NPDC050759 TaxID=3365635 RepID=UPI0037B9BA16
MEFCLLGPVEVRASGRLLAPFARKPTALLTAGLLDAGRVVSVDRLIDAVWGESPPDTAAKLVQSYVSRLRQVLHRPDRPEVIVTRPGGYLFLARPDGLDVRRFQELLERGRTQAGKGEHATAANTLEAALGLWRGPALGGPATSSLQLEAARLEEMRMTAVEEMLDARLAAGGGAELVGELTRLVDGQPLRERPRGLLMAALHRCGRRAEALRVYRDGHRVLRTELGIEPSHALRDLHARLLTGDVRDTARPADGVPDTANRAPAVTPAAEHQEETRRPTAHPSPVPTPVRAVPPVRRGRQGKRPGLPPPAQLPAPPRRLTGRDAEADRLVSALLDTGTGTDTGPRLCVIHGMAGVGKSALTLDVANRLAAAFPDGQLYAELCGADPAQAAPPDRILGGFLHALGIRPTRLPASTAERAAAYRSLLAGRRVLVVLDDAAAEHQVRPLLPGAGAGAVLVNSRRTLPGLDATARVGLEVLDREQTLRLLGRLVGHDRLTAEATAAGEIARWSGGLPLAVQAVGSRLRTNDRWRLRTLADRLGDESRRLDELACGDLDVRAGIKAGCRALREPERRALHLLGLLGLPDFAAWVAGSLLGVDLPSAQHLVERLAGARLLEPLGVDGAGQTRYRFHDLVRLYARERAEQEIPPEQRLAAVSRLLRSWLTLVCRAGAIEAGGTVHLKPRAAHDAADPTLAAMLLDRPGAWLASEHTSLVTAVDRAAGLGLDEQVGDLAAALVQVRLRVHGWFAPPPRPTTA